MPAKKRSARENLEYPLKPPRKSPSCLEDDVQASVIVFAALHKSASSSDPENDVPEATATGLTFSIRESVS